MNDIAQAWETPATEDTAQVLNVYKRHMERRGRTEYTADDARRIGMMLKLFDCEPGALAAALSDSAQVVTNFNLPKAKQGAPSA